MNGWIKLHRQITDNHLWLGETFSKGQAWVDLILLANHKPKIIWKRGIKIEVNRGELAWSEQKLADRWGWSRGKVKRFLKHLETVQQIVHQKNHTVSRIIIINYGQFQGNGTTDGTTDGTNNKNVKNVKNILGETSSPKTDNQKKDMSWNTKSDEYEEGVVDLDGDGSLAEEKKPSTRKYPNAPAVRKLFQETLGRNPANWRVNKNQLQACENLYTERGLEKIKSALWYYKDNQNKEYIPLIDSPYDLDSKWTKLGQHKLNNQ